MWEFPKIRGTLFWGPYNKDPTIEVLYWGPLFSKTPMFSDASRVSLRLYGSYKGSARVF